MNTYYCYPCRKALNLCAPPANVDNLNFTGSQYTLEKFMKHTVPASGSNKRINSIYSDPTYETYKEYCVNGTASGSLEVQSDGTQNLIWLAGKTLGPAFENGRVLFSGDTVKIIFADNTGSLHHYHVDSSKYQTAVCANCGGSVLM